MIKLLWFLFLALFLDTSDDDSDPDDAGDDSDPDSDADSADDSDNDDDGDGKSKGKDDLRKTFGEIDQLDEKGAKNQLKARLEQYQRLCRKLSKKDAQIKRLSKQIEDAESAANAELRKENSFLRTSITSGESLDLDTAWTLMTTKGFMDAVEVKDDGTVEGMEEALSKLLNRYPYLRDIDLIDDEPDETDNGSKHGASGRRMNAKKSDTNVDTTALMNRFPALRGRRRI